MKQQLIKVVGVVIFAFTVSAFLGILGDRISEGLGALVWVLSMLLAGVIAWRAWDDLRGRQWRLPIWAWVSAVCFVLALVLVPSVETGTGSDTVARSTRTPASVPVLDCFNDAVVESPRRVSGTQAEIDTLCRKAAAPPVPTMGPQRTPAPRLTRTPVPVTVLDCFNGAFVEFEGPLSSLPSRPETDALCRKAAAPPVPTMGPATAIPLSVAAATPEPAATATSVPTPTATSVPTPTATSVPTPRPAATTSNAAEVRAQMLILDTTIGALFWEATDAELDDIYATLCDVAGGLSADDFARRMVDSFEGYSQTQLGSIASGMAIYCPTVYDRITAEL